MQRSALGTDFSYEECQEVPNVFVAAIGLAVLTLACAIFICRPLHPLLSKILPSIGAGASFSSHTAAIVTLGLLMFCSSLYSHNPELPTWLFKLLRFNSCEVQSLISQTRLLCIAAWGNYMVVCMY